MAQCIPKVILLVEAAGFWEGAATKSMPRSLSNRHVKYGFVGQVGSVRVCDDNTSLTDISFQMSSVPLATSPGQKATCNAAAGNLPQLKHAMAMVKLLPTSAGWPPLTHWAGTRLQLASMFVASARQRWRLMQHEGSGLGTNMCQAIYDLWPAQVRKLHCFQGSRQAHSHPACTAANAHLSAAAPRQGAGETRRPWLHGLFIGRQIHIRYDVSCT